MLPDGALAEFMPRVRKVAPIRNAARNLRFDALIEPVTGSAGATINSTWLGLPVCGQLPPVAGMFHTTMSASLAGRIDAGGRCS